MSELADQVAQEVMGWKMNPHRTHWITDKGSYLIRPNWNPDTDHNDMARMLGRMIELRLSPQIWHDGKAWNVRFWHAQGWPWGDCGINLPETAANAALTAVRGARAEADESSE